MKKKLLV